MRSRAHALESSGRLVASSGPPQALWTRLKRPCYRLRDREGADIGETKFGAPVLNLADIKVGEEKTGKAVLEPGRYELSCLVVHSDDNVNLYEKGMYVF